MRWNSELDAKRTMRLNGIFLALAVGLAAGCRPCSQPHHETRDVVLTEGMRPSVSPDGQRMAFERPAGPDTWLGICDLKRPTDVTWVEKGGTRAAYASWTPTGDLLYAQSNQRHTGYENFYAKTVCEGFGLRRWRNGISTDLIDRGRSFDIAPVADPDGKHVWFCSTRSSSNEGVLSTIRTSIYKAEIGRKGSAKFCYTPSPDRPSGATQVTVSPDGRHVVWAQLADVHMSWGLAASRAGDFSKRVMLTPPEMAALSPKWNADGTLLAFTGFRPGDDGWQVYVMDPRQNAIRRICRGENPSFSPDGRSLVYDHDGKIHLREFKPSDRPTARDVPPVSESRQRWFTPEKVLWSTENVAKFRREPLPKEAIFGTSKTLFIRARVVWNGDTKKFQEILCTFYGEYPAGAGFQLYIPTSGRPTMVSRNAIKWWQHIGSSAVLKPNCEYTITGIRTDGALWISVNDGPVDRIVLGAGQITLDHPETVQLGNGFQFDKGSKILKAEIGAGWPSNVPQPKGNGAYVWEDIQ